MCAAWRVFWHTAGHDMNSLVWRWLTAGYVQAGLVSLGILLRTIHYLENRSFWQDEICLALSIVNRSFTAIVHNVLLFPDFAQAPLLFQLVEKSAVVVLGNTEMALRLFPFLAGVAALFLARRFFNRLLGPAAATLALALFVLAEPLVYFAAELKPYGIDVFAVFLVYEMFFALKDRWTPGRLVIFMAGGAVVIWLSNAMLFILGGAGLVLGLDQLRRREWHRCLGLGIAYGVWLISFLLLYKLSLSGMLNPELLKNWRLAGGFSPDPLWTWGWLVWMGKACLALFRVPLGLAWPYLMAVFFAAGCWSFFRRDRFLLWLLTVPLGLALLAGVLDKYPFFERLVIFLVPGMLVLLAAGMQAAASAVTGRGQAWAAGVIIAAVFWFPVSAAAWHAVHPRGNEDNRAAMRYMADHYRPGDLVALSSQAQYPFWYYGERFGLNSRLVTSPVGTSGERATLVIQLFPNMVTQAGRNMLALRQTLSIYDARGFYRSFRLAARSSTPMFVPADAPAALQGMGRVWVFLSHHNDAHFPGFVNQVFARAGERLEYLERPGVCVALYNIPPDDRKN